MPEGQHVGVGLGPVIADDGRGVGPDRDDVVEVVGEPAIGPEPARPPGRRSALGKDRVELQRSRSSSPRGSRPLGSARRSRREDTARDRAFKPRPVPPRRDPAAAPAAGPGVRHCGDEAETHRNDGEPAMTDRYAKYEKLKIDRPDERILRITFDNPATYNSLDRTGTGRSPTSGATSTRIAT